MSKFEKFQLLASKILMWVPGYGTKLTLRALHTEIGALSGSVSVIDQGIAKEKKLKPLNRLERWLMAPRIAFEKNSRKDVYRTTCVDFLGEDPFADDDYYEYVEGVLPHDFPALTT